MEHDCRFPQDDEYSMQQGDLHGCGCGNLDIFYKSQYVHGEVASLGSHTGDSLTFLLERVPILNDTLSAIVFRDGFPIQNINPCSGGFTINDEISSDGYPKVVGVELQTATGILKLTWGENIDKDRIKLVVNYEYDMEIPPKE